MFDLNLRFVKMTSLIIYTNSTEKSISQVIASASNRSFEGW